MFRLISLIVISVFIFWLIPMGIFIAPSKERTLCGGKRAVCLCSGKTTTAKAEGAVSGVTVKSSGAPNKEQNPSGGSGHPFTFARSIIETNIRLDRLFTERIAFYTNPSLCSLEHVPKA